jgi:hypothetical protein
VQTRIHGQIAHRRCRYLGRFRSRCRRVAQHFGKVLISRPVSRRNMSGVIENRTALPKYFGWFRSHHPVSELSTLPNRRNPVCVVEYIGSYLTHAHDVPHQPGTRALIPRAMRPILRDILMEGPLVSRPLRENALSNR